MEVNQTTSWTQLDHVTMVSNVTEYLNTTEEEEVKSFVADGRIIRVAVFPILIVLGTIGNLLTILVMWKGTMIKSPIGLYMSVLAVADTGM